MNYLSMIKSYLILKLYQESIFTLEIYQRTFFSLILKLQSYQLSQPHLRISISIIGISSSDQSCAQLTRPQHLQARQESTLSLF
ncbi:hypothetical protein FGO68_gene5229 [Halteria grandinella]|uniref:Uncharacterized protein n=1 Tax=Halteria grandinella TaxID=5974 RepID=A0A8J8SUC1_HALGN|nr:hypothetical protein FGO68_gene5229 [Halteria grandinella]